MNMASALIRLWNCTQQHPGTSGARACAAILLGLYNGARFPIDLNLLRALDATLRQAALVVINGDASRAHAEVHELLNNLTGRSDFGPRFEQLAAEWRFKGKHKAEWLSEVTPPRLAINEA